MQNVQTTMNGYAWRSGTLDSTGTIAIQMIQDPQHNSNPPPNPATITLNTTAGGKTIQFSTNDDKSLLFTPAYATSHANQLVAVTGSGIAWAVLTGAAGDTWNIR